MSFADKDFEHIRNSRIAEMFREVFTIQVRDPEDLYERQKMFEELIKLDKHEELGGLSEHLVYSIESLSNYHLNCRFYSDKCL